MKILSIFSVGDVLLKRAYEPSADIDISPNPLLLKEAEGTPIGDGTSKRSGTTLGKKVNTNRASARTASGSIKLWVYILYGRGIFISLSGHLVSIYTAESSEETSKPGILT